MQLFAVMSQVLRTWPGQLAMVSTASLASIALQHIPSQGADWAKYPVACMTCVVATRWTIDKIAALL